MLKNSKGFQAYIQVVNSTGKHMKGEHWWGVKGIPAGI